ncbi:MAG: hypothetical protein C4527_20305 [Candidatus Omnitrophota bacterium]|jgi:hypothetical protein|nr:MAG: hypothetical protein C4527_20305 [Candidatus Omnitrophota bacterium]
MKKKSILFISLILIIISFAVSGFCQDVKRLSTSQVEEGLLAPRIVENSFLSNKPLEVRSMSGNGNLHLSEGNIYTMDENERESFQSLSEGENNYFSYVVAKSGTSIAYVPDRGQDAVHEIYVRRGIGQTGVFENPRLIYRHSLPRPYASIRLMGISDRGDVLLWRESVTGGNRMMMYDGRSRVDAEPLVLFEARNLSYEGVLSADGNHVFFFVIRSHDLRFDHTTLYSTKDGDLWTEPEPISAEGKIYPAIVWDVNDDASLILMAYHILKRNGRQFELYRSYEIDDRAIYTPQMSDDGNWVSFVSSNEDMSDIRRVRDIMNETKPTRNLILLQWKQDDPATGSYTRHPLDTFYGIITFRLFDDGSEILWNTQ